MGGDTLPHFLRILGVSMRRTLAVLAVGATFACSTAYVYADTSIATVFHQLEQQYQLPTDILAKVANIESGGNPTAGSPDRAYGMFQWFERYWVPASRAAYGRALDPSLRTNPSVSAKVTAVSLADAKFKNGALIQRAGVDMTLGLYMNHFLGTGGASKFLQAYMQDPKQNASAIFPKEAANNKGVFSGRTLADVLNFLANKLKVTGVSMNVAGNFQDPYGISYAYSNADVSSKDFLPAGYVATGQDPWTYPTSYNYNGQQTTGLASPVSIGQPVQVSSGLAAGQVASQDTYCVTSTNPIVVVPVPAGSVMPSNCYNSSAQPQSYAQQQTTQQRQTTQSTTGSSGANTGGNTAQILASMAGSGTTYSATSSQANPNVPPAALLIAQPNTVSPGGLILLSWATVGMSQDTPCQLYQGTTLILTANEGSKGVPVPTDTPSGAATFTLKCTSYTSAQQYVRSVKVTVQ